MSFSLIGVVSLFLRHQLQTGMGFWLQPLVSGGVREWGTARPGGVFLAGVAGGFLHDAWSRSSFLIVVTSFETREAQKYLLASRNLLSLDQAVRRVGIAHM